jgi:hypothetical protein
LALLLDVFKEPVKYSGDFGAGGAAFGVKGVSRLSADDAGFKKFLYGVFGIAIHIGIVGNNFFAVLGSMWYFRAISV